MLSSLLSFVPLLSLLLGALFFGIRFGVLVGFLGTCIMLWFMEVSPFIFGAIGVTSLFMTLQILFIIFGAMLLHATMQHTGLFDAIKEQLKLLHPQKDVRFFLIAMVFTCFFEGVAGFGTPGAIIPPILIMLGYPVVRSVVTVLLFDAVFVVFGAVGAPIFLGLVNPLGLLPAEAATISWQSTVVLFVPALIILASTLLLYRKDEKSVHVRVVFLWFLVLYGLFMLWSFIWPPLASVGAAITSIVGMLFFAIRAGNKLTLKPWIPYIVLVVLLLLPLVPIVGQFQNIVLGLSDLWGTGINATLKVGTSPLWAFLFVSMGILMFTRSSMPDMRPVLARIAYATMILLPLLAMTQMMTVGEFSMIHQMGKSLAGLGEFNVFIAPLIGALGTFVAGSTTVSNILLGSTQVEVARQVAVDPIWMLVLLTAGGALGNAVCLYNIIAACSVAHIQDYKVVLRATIIPVVLSLVVVGVIGVLWV